MAKRMTDTDKWKKPFIKSLPAEYKLFWLFLLDECDHAGIWHIEMDVLELRLGIKLSLEKARGFFKEKIVVFDSGNKIFVPDFITFQYGVLSPANKAHNSVINILTRYNLMGHTSPLEGAKDMVKDKDKDIKGGMGEKPSFETIHRVFVQNGGSKEMAEHFFNTHEATEWRTRNGPIRNYAPLISNYIQNWKQNELNTNRTGKRTSKAATADELAAYILGGSPNS